MNIKFGKFLGIILGCLFLGACGGNSSDPSLNSGLPDHAGVRYASATGNPPSMSGFAPAWQDAGSMITISGTHFDPVAANNSVLFANDVPAVVASATASTLRVIVPQGAISGPITLATAGGTIISPTSFVLRTAGGSTAPSIGSFLEKGHVGATITISGSNFDAVDPAFNQVTFNGTPAVVLTAAATSLEVKIPNGIHGNITVTTAGGTAVSAYPFYFLPPAADVPSIDRFVPLLGRADMEVTISGAHFSPVPEDNLVRFNGVIAEVKTASSTELTVVVPPGAKSGPIAVKVAGVTGKSSEIFQVTGGELPVAGLLGGSIQGTPLNLLGTVLTYAGGGIANSAADGEGQNASFNNPLSMTSDGDHLYVADAGNRVIRKIHLPTGMVTTIAGSGVAGALDGTGKGASFATPTGITTDGFSLFVTDSGNNRIRKIAPLAGTGSLAEMTSANAQVTTLAGTGSILTLDAAAGVEAAIRSPQGIATDGTFLYVADGSNRIRRIAVAAPSPVTTLAGSGKWKSEDGIGTGASFYRPRGVAISPDLNTLYVTDNGTNVIRQIEIATGSVATPIGPGLMLGDKASKLQNPSGIFHDGDSLYVADAGNNRILRIELANMQASVLAGTGQIGSADGEGEQATFRLPNGITLVGDRLYISDSANNLLRELILSTRVVSTLAGRVFDSNPLDGIGLSSKFNFPYGIASDGQHLYVADSGRNLIRKIVIATSEVSILAGSGYFGAVDARGKQASFNHPFGITTDGARLFVADSGNNKVRQITLATGDVVTLAGSGDYGAFDGTGAEASFSRPIGITTDGVNLYVADTGSNKIRKVVIATAEVSTLAGSGVAGFHDAEGSIARFSAPAGVTTDGNFVYVADQGNNRIRRIAIASSEVSTVAGTGDYWYNDIYDSQVIGGWWPAEQSNFRRPAGIAMDGDNLYVADSENNEIRQIDLVSRRVRTLAGSGAFGVMDGTGTEASFSQPAGIVTDGIHLYTTDYASNLIRKIQ